MKLLPALLLGLGVTGQQAKGDRRRHSKRQIEDYQPYYDDEVKLSRFFGPLFYTFSISMTVQAHQ